MRIRIPSGGILITPAVSFNVTAETSGTVDPLVADDRFLGDRDGFLDRPDLVLLVETVERGPARSALDQPAPTLDRLDEAIQSHERQTHAGDR